MTSSTNPDRKMRRVSTVLILILALLVPLGTAQRAIAQDVSEDGFTDDFTYESLFGYTLTWDETWDLDTDGSGYYVADLADSLYFTKDNGISSVSIVALPSIGSVSSSLSFYTEYYGGVLDTPELVETESNKQEGRSLIRFEFDNTAYALYLRLFLTEDLSSEIQVVTIGELDGYDGVIESVQETFGVDGEPILADLDPDDVLTVFEDGDPVPFPTPSGQIGSEDEDDDPSENEDIKLPEDEEPDDEETDPQPTEEDEDTADPDPTEDVEDSDASPTEEDTEGDLEDQGLIGDGEYESPQFGIQLDWTTDWEAYPDGIDSDDQFEVDRFALIGTDLDASFYLTIFSIDTLTAEEWATQFETLIEESPDNLEIIDQSVEDDVQLLLYSFDFDGESGFGVVEVYEDTENDALIIVEVSGSEDTVVDAFESAQGDIELNGDVPFLVTQEVPELP